MNKPNFSITIIAKNESKTLPHLIKSLKEFKSRGGEIILLDTGSTDGTPKIAKKMGCKVTKVGNKFHHTISAKLAKKINKTFVVGDEKPVVKAGDKYFDFASARNYCSSLASNDWVSFVDADEQFTRLDIDKINDIIKNPNLAHLEYQFIFSHDQFNKPAIQFVQSKMFNRNKIEWVGIVHEVVSPINGGGSKVYLPPDIFLLEHWQEQHERHSYLIGLAVDCYLHPNKDRNSHYMARELLWTGRPKSAIKEFKRHIAMKRWSAERAQSMIFISRAYGQLNQPEKQVEWLNKAFYTDSSRREALIELAYFYRSNNNYQAVASYAAAAMEIPWTGKFYASDRANYENVPHELMYWAKGFLGDIDGAKKHLLKALEYRPLSPTCLRDTEFYFEYPDQGIDGWMTFPELQFLYNTAKKMDSIVEIGSWMGRSTHALLSGCKGTVIAVDTFRGSNEPRDLTYKKGIPLKVYEKFKENVGHFDNLKIMRMTSKRAAEKLKGKKFDMVFIDAGHNKEDVEKDIELWKDKAKILICGHDYVSGKGMGVVEAVDESIGELDGVEDTIWYKYVNKPFVSIIIPTLGRPDKLNRLLRLIKENAGYDNYEVIVKHDQFPPNNKGVPKILKEGVKESRGDLVMYLGNDCVPKKDFLQLAVFRMIKEFPKLDGLIGLNDGYWERGEMATHWLASKKLLPYLGGEFFHTGYFHTGCDNELTEMCRKIGKYVWAEEAKLDHDHPMKTGFKDKMDEVYKLAYREDRREHDRKLIKKRSKKLGFEIRENFVRPDRIPKTIFTIWLSDKKKRPALVDRCIKTHKLKGYKHRMITLDNCFRNKYVNDAIKAKMWGKACDYLRCHYLIKEGGIYLDADVEMLAGKNFDHLLGNHIFAGRENNNFVNTAVLGAEKGCQLLKDHLREVVMRFKGDDGLFFESSIEIITPRLYRGATVLEPEYFYPYDHQQGTTNITDKTICIHYFLKSWKV